MFATLMVMAPRAWHLTDRFASPKGVLFHATALVAGGACLASVRRWRFDAVDVSVGAFAALGILSALTVAHNPWLALGAVGMTLSGGILFVCARALAEGGRRGALLLAVMMAAGLLAFSMLLEAHGPLEGLSMKRAPGGVLGHRNRAAHLLVLSLPVAWLCFTRARDRRVLGVLAANVVVMGAAITLSRSRAAWLAVLVIGLGMVGSWALRARDVSGTRKRTVGFVVALLVGAGAALVIPNTLDWRTSYLDTLSRIGEHQAGSGRGRLVQYANTLRMVAETPLLGVGPGNWMVHYPRYATSGDPSHAPDELVPVSPLPQSDWMGMLAERGVLAVLALATVAGLLFVECWRRAREETCPEPRTEALALMAVLVGLLVLGGLDAVLMTPTAAFFVAVIVGALARPQREWGGLGSGAVWRGAAMAAVLMLTSGPLVYGTVKGWARRLAYLQPLTTGRLTQAIRLDPGNYEARVLMGGVLARAGQCEQALAMLRQANHLLPHAEAPMRMWSRCGQQMPGQELSARQSNEDSNGQHRASRGGVQDVVTQSVEGKDLPRSRLPRAGSGSQPDGQSQDEPFEVLGSQECGMGRDAGARARGEQRDVLGGDSQLIGQVPPSILPMLGP
ncbi:O-antigen ligase family protein [Pyxidicoccus trucidator]|uniref:O-antigen ligase family protein n=1 Tax=Pyxidicoccus trucidator TaxID=2709662 RepID=UPI0013D9C9BF|nr:O-antigen ligase family protein [Pyxidicoccus trucidator]